MAITDWPAAERPREKLVKQGAAALSDAELLAIFLRTGVKGLTAVDLARQLLTEFGSLRDLLAADRAQFCAAHGLGEAKFVQLQAVLEMASRHLSERMQRGTPIDSAELAKQLALSQLRDQPNETFAAMFLDNQHQLLRFRVLFQGTIDQAAVYPRVIAEAALEEGAAAVILCHNHPSGVAEPSDADLRITLRIRDALQLLDIRLLDHLVVGDCVVTSLAARGAI